MTSLKITTMGDETVVVLTPELVQRLQATAGGELHAVQSPCGVELVSSADIAIQLEIARGVMEQDREALSRLAE